MPASPHTARKLACTVLQTIYRTQAFADDVFDATVQDVSLSAQDRALAFELVYGVLRHVIMLDWRLNHISRKPMARLPLNVATTLRVAAYQLLYLDRIPPSAAVNEAVNLIRSQPGHHWGGLVNAILRNLIRQPAPPLPDTDAIQALSVRYSCPPWMVERWLQAFGLAQAEAICRQTLEIPSVTLRTNRLRCTRQALQDRLLAEGFSAEETMVSPIGLRLEKCGNPSQLSVVQEGWCYIEDEAAQLIPPLMDPQPGERILDTCAAPGGKTTHLAQLMENQGCIIALDRQPERLGRIHDNCQRLGIKIVQAYAYDMVANDLPTIHNGNGAGFSSSANFLIEKPFDRILVDAPCSGLGILRRHPEGKMWKQPSNIQQAQITQRQILDRVCNLLRPGGILVYSACSFEPEETIGVVTDFCHRHPEFDQESLASWVPASGHALVNQTGHLCTAGNSWKMDGFFACRLRKTTR